MPLRTLAALALACSLGACTTVTAGAFGTDPSRVDMNGSPSVALDYAAPHVWARTKELLAHLSTRVPQFEDEGRRAYATVDDGAILAEVLELEPGHARLAVKARRYGKIDDRLARSVLARIEEEVER